MPTTYTPLLKVAKPGAGELDGSWGDVVNNNITTMLEEAIAGRSVIDSWSGNSHTLTEANGTTSEARSAMLELAGAPTAAATVICPNSSKIYVVSNGCGFDATIKTAAGTGVTVANGATKIVFCDGTNVKVAVSGVEDHAHAISDVTGLQSALDGKQVAGSYLTAETDTLNSVTGRGATTANRITVGGLTLTNSYIEETVNTTGVTGSTALDPNNGTVQRLTLSGDTTFTDSLVNGESIVLHIDDGTARTITWPTMDWVGGSAPTLDTTNETVIVVWKLNNTLYGALVGASS